jgi:hypothetical protein
MKHITEDELILYFYGESRRAGQIDHHLSECAECASLYKAVASTLTLVETPETPARDESYGEQVWQRIRYDLPEQESVSWTAWLRWHAAPVAVAAALLVAVGAAVLVSARHTPQPTRAIATAPAAAPAGDSHADESERARLAAIGDHLEQSERVLMDVVNAEGPSVDVSVQQLSAESLVDANRFYRDAAASAGDADVAALLDELERSLLDLAHGPSTLSAAELQRAARRLDSTTLLFKIRVLSDELRERERAPAKPGTTL